MYTADMSSQTTARPVPQETPSPSFLTAFLTWCFIFAVAALAIFELRAPDPEPVTAPVDHFSALRAMTHVRAIAQVPHPIGSGANTAARDYLVAQLSAFGMGPQVVTAIGSYRSEEHTSELQSPMYL